MHCLVDWFLGDMTSLCWNMVGACKPPTSDTKGHSLDYVLGTRLSDHSSKHKNNFPEAKSMGNMAKKMNLRDIFVAVLRI